MLNTDLLMVLDIDLLMVLDIDLLMVDKYFRKIQLIRELHSKVINYQSELDQDFLKIDP